MKSSASWKRDELQLMPADSSQTDQTASPDRITTLKELSLRLLREVQAFGDVNAPTIDGGIDFYEEVSRFEIDLIKRALLQTGGHQGRAAKLLNLKITTLNSKIKHYNITLTGLAKGFSLVESGTDRSPQHA